MLILLARRLTGVGPTDKVPAEEPTLVTPRIVQLARRVRLTADNYLGRLPFFAAPDATRTARRRTEAELAIEIVHNA